jgi:serine/threonine-protein kinase
LTTLTQATFQVTLQEVPSDTVPKGKVVGTDPAAGTPLPRGAPVKLVVSTGPALVDVPNMVGKTRAEAEAELNGRLGFGLEIRLTNGGPTKKGLVIAQNPAGGQAPKASTIVLLVGI